MSRKFIYFFIGIVLISAFIRIESFAEVSNPSAAESEKQKQLIQIKEKVLSFKKSLLTQLQEGLKKSPHDAIEVCHTKAVKIAEENSTLQFKIGRTSHKLRNEKNIAPEWTRNILEKMKSTTVEKPAEAVFVELGNSKWGYVEPLYTQALCLTCHGTEISKDLNQTISKKYPKDKAFGFKLGDFRGLVWVESSK